MPYACIPTVREVGAGELMSFRQPELLWLS